MDIVVDFLVRFASHKYTDIQPIQEDSEFSDEDIALIKDRLKNEDFYFPVQVYLCNGKNF